MSGLIAPRVGHVGDGNSHLAILVDPDSDDEMDRARAIWPPRSTRLPCHSAAP
ncbi:hypothetical protein PAF17_19275 [Paracoccus sp. Z330]|uniref:FAD-binding oxidoreductase/transferase type 4 C-terminal domain-containing protein n=1 Tax=Paracoccus onchidii TaxID=3017813 RepID=A0ABT4ZJR9_9RHOB|nr:FAD-linked oxidase C-terminal domain-containing protein [Paracoccus onchidii]MDB6179609.1 hypothetical protein [Paracoccus onchidii]